MNGAEQRNSVEKACWCPGVLSVSWLPERVVSVRAMERNRSQDMLSVSQILHALRVAGGNIVACSAHSVLVVFTGGPVPSPGVPSCRTAIVQMRSGVRPAGST